MRGGVGVGEGVGVSVGESVGVTEGVIDWFEHAANNRLQNNDRIAKAALEGNRHACISVSFLGQLFSVMDFSFTSILAHSITTGA